MRIAVAGHGQLAVGLLTALLDSCHEVVAVLQNGRTHRGRLGRASTRAEGVLGPQSTMAGWALRSGIPILWLDRLDEAELAPLRALEPDLIVVGGFSIIFKRSILDLPRHGCLNVHSSLLPKHRGPNPFMAVVLAGELESGVTFHVMDEGIDTGDIVAQAPFALDHFDTAMSVYDKACRVAANAVCDVVDGVERDGLRGTPQDSAAASYDRKVTENEAYVDWTRPAEEIERMGRALKPGPLPRFRHKGRTILASCFMLENGRGEAAGAVPGTVVAVKPFVRVAAGQGTVAIRDAYAAGAIPWRWPSAWQRVKCGEVLG